MRAPPDRGECLSPGHPAQPVFHGDYSFNTGQSNKLTSPDYIVFALVMSGPFFIGFYQAWQSRKTQTLHEFLLGERSISGVPMGFSICASFTSAVTILGTPADAYLHSTMFVWFSVTLFMAAVASAHIFHPVFYRKVMATSHEYLELRFSRSVRSLAAAMFLLQKIMYLSIMLYAPSVALQKVAGISLSGAIVSTSIICIIATAFGGMKGIVWSDIYYMVIMLLSLVLVLVRAHQVVGGWGELWAANVRADRILFDDVRLHPGVRHTVWSILFGGFFTVTSFQAVNQTRIQKVLSCNTLRDAKIAMYVACLLHTCVVCLGVLLGLYIGAFYENCDPAKAQLIDNYNELLPLFATDILADSYGMVGLFGAGIVSGSLSTIASVLCATVSSILEDFLLSYHRHTMSDQTSRLLSQLLVIVLGALCMSGAFLAPNLGNVLEMSLTVFGASIAPVLGVFSLGMFFPRANSKGALWGLCGSTAINLFLAVASRFSNIENPNSILCTRNCDASAFPNSTDAATSISGNDLAKFNMSYLWISTVAVFSCIAIGLIVSCATGREDAASVDPDLLVSPCDVLFPLYYLPESFRGRIRINQPVPVPQDLSTYDDWSKPSFQLGTFRQSNETTHSKSYKSSQIGSDVDYDECEGEDFERATSAVSH